MSGTAFLLERLQDGEHERAKCGQVVTTFLYEHCGLVDAREETAGFGETCGRDVEWALGVCTRRVDTERHDERIRCLARDPRDDFRERRGPAVVTGTGRERHVEVGVRAVAV